MNPFSLFGKNIIITGASSGIGRQIAIQCAEMGARVVLIGRNESRLNDTFCKLHGTGHISIALDITKFSLIPSYIDRIHQEIGTIDGLVNCAGVSDTFSLKSMTEDRIRYFFETNVYSSIILTREVSRKKYFNPKGGSIIFISSIMSIVGAKGKSLYSMSKGALTSGVRSLAIELADRRIRVNSISPGTIITPINENLPHISDIESREHLRALHPLGFGEVSDIAHGCVYLLSDASKWLTGQNLCIDGGYTIV